MIIEGKAYWAKVLKPVDTYAKDGKEYTLDLVVSEEVQAAYNAEGYTSGIRPATNKNGKLHKSGEDYIQFKRPTHTRKGEAIPAPKVVDRYGNDWPVDEAIGNGSILRVIIGKREGDFNGTKWVKPSLNKIQIWEHVPLEPAEDFDYEEGAPVQEEEDWDDAEE